MVRRWSASIVMGAGVTLALMSAVMAFVMPDEATGDRYLVLDGFQSEQPGYRLPFYPPHGGHRCYDCSTWWPEPPELPPLNLQMPVQPVHLPMPVAEPIVPGDGFTLGRHARYTPPEGILWEGIFPGPAYPAAAMEAGLEGHVTLRYDISRDGYATNITVVEAEPPGVFEDAVIAALRRTRFPLGADEEGNVKTWENQHYRMEFRLSDEEATP